MSGQENSELKSLEARLAMLSPRPDRLDRDRLMFLAGQASVAEEKVQRGTILGVSLENRAWPAAFVAMSAVAAMLFVMLIAMHDRVAPQRFPIAETAHENKASIGHDRRSANSVWSTLDAHIADIDRLLARDGSQSGVVGSSTDQVEIRTGPILTPARWGQVLNEADRLDTSPNGASTFRPSQGVNS